MKKYNTGGIIFSPSSWSQSPTVTQSLQGSQVSTRLSQYGDSTLHMSIPRHSSCDSRRTNSTGLCSSRARTIAQSTVAITNCSSKNTNEGTLGNPRQKLGSFERVLEALWRQLTRNQRSGHLGLHKPMSTIWSERQESYFITVVTQGCSQWPHSQGVGV